MPIGPYMEWTIDPKIPRKAIKKINTIELSINPIMLMIKPALASASYFLFLFPCTIPMIPMMDPAREATPVIPQTRDRMPRIRAVMLLLSFFL
jgi:hypothetical protein